jgi:type II secretory pathway component GspD/PulD (secretin)
MRATAPFAVSVLFCALAFAQDTPQTNKVLYFAHTVSPRGVQEVVNCLRSVTEMQRVTADSSGRSITVSGSASQMALGEWMFQNLDQPADARPASPAQYTVDGSPLSAVRVFYLANSLLPQQMQEIINAVRAMAEVQRIAAFNDVHAVVARAQPNHIALAEWVVSQLDPSSSPGAAPSQNPATFAYHADFIHDTAVAARVFHLTNAKQPQELQQIVNSIRSATEIQRIAVFPRGAEIALRGTEDQAALAEWLIKRLDKPAGAQPSGAMEYQMPGNAATPLVEVYYLAHLDKAEDIQDLVRSIRVGAQLQRLTAYLPTRAIVVRGSGEQVAEATALVQERDKPAVQ